MTRILGFAAGALLSVLGIVGTAPAGPGDSEPLGPGPHVIVHAPATYSAKAATIDIWVHTHHFDCGTVTGFVPGTATGYAIYDMGNGSWDEKFTISVASLPVPGTVTWLADSTDLCEWSTYTGTGSTVFTN